MNSKIPVKDINPENSGSDDLVKQMKESGGFVAKKIGVGVDILEEMCKEDKCINFLSFPSAIVSTGARGLIKELVKRKLVDVVITTCGTWDHDLSRVWKDYYHGRFDMDDSELWKDKTHREGNVLIPHEHHGVVLEEKIMPILEELYNEGKKELSTRELTFEIGKRLENEKNKEDSIIYWCYKNSIPFFVPGPTDGTVGSNLWMFSESHLDFKLNLFKDEHELNNIVLDAEKTGSLMIGGGISKHHTIWWNQFRGGLDYSVYITTAPEWDGSLSGARVREGISWGKVRDDAKYITIEGDATTILPLMVSSLIERLK